MVEDRQKAPALVVLAAGMGSRYGGLKQLEPVGPAGETIMDYSVHDACRAGFARLVFVIRRDMEREFRETVGSRYEERLPVEYAFQELEDLPGGLRPPEGREKPWGTLHAVLAARTLLSEPFAVLNADDFYGARSLAALGAWLRRQRRSRNGVDEYAMVGFPLRQTLSEHGHVSRGVCRTDAEGWLEQIVERTHITPFQENAVYEDSTGRAFPISGDALVSMNLWGFTPGFLPRAARIFEEFMRGPGGRDLKAECYLPEAVARLIERGEARVRVLDTPERWFGVTYREDREQVRQALAELCAQGVYPCPLAGRPAADPS